ncbi:fimbrial biogenesis chaperone [Endozoicomonas ascidiicola]|uniref:fimbrial biogenesis chaperone n=1 Tax=Endozoicomonas ascidiicola TaxID=1698521 RepID=UPI000A692160|nr:fimbria/pilus periplasmic chaperone [Endozoicomonas ascidiicola]
MLRNKIASLISLMAMLVISSQAMATMSLDRMIVYFKPDQLPRQDIIVTNPDKENLYLQTEVYKVVNPGTEKEERVRVTDPTEIKLLATPGKAVISPNGRKTVRLVSLETPKEKELVYRVTFRPVVGELEAKQTAIKLLVAYQALVFVRPENPKYKVSAKVAGGKMTFTNSGNINVVLRNGKYCTSKKPESCTDLSDGNRIYAGEHWEMPLPEAAKTGKGFIQYGLFDGEFEETEQFSL